MREYSIKLSSVNKLSQTHPILSIQQPHGDMPTPISWMRKSNLQINFLIFPATNKKQALKPRSSGFKPMLFAFSHSCLLCDFQFFIFLHIISAHPERNLASNLLFCWEPHTDYQPEEGLQFPTPCADPRLSCLLHGNTTSFKDASGTISEIEENV